MNFKNYLNEGSLRAKKTKVKITDGPYEGNEGLFVFSGVTFHDVRYYVIELDHPVKGVEVVIVHNGEFDEI
jgi:hypothetical protein